MIIIVAITFLGQMLILTWYSLVLACYKSLVSEQVLNMLIVVATVIFNSEDTCYFINSV